MTGGGPAGIFISYRRADGSWPARWLGDRLAQQFGAGVVFQDVDSIEPGDDFAAAIEEAVGACAVLLAVIGPRWLTAESDSGRRLDDPADWVRLEIEAAFNRGVRIIPVLVDGAKMPAASELPSTLRGLAHRQAVALNPASLDTRRLVSVLETAIASEGKPTGEEVTRPPEPTRSARSQTSRLLVSAVHDASTLTDGARVNALSAIIRAATVAAPERVGWLAAEAETAARSIAIEQDRPRALAWIADAMWAADPERAGRLAAEAETVARSIEDPFSRGVALAEVARAVASADPEHAETVARSIENELGRVYALTWVAQAMAAADPERAGWLAAEADTFARSIEDISSRQSALAEIARTVAAADPERAEAIARSIESAHWLRLPALAGVAQAVAAADPERAEAIARSIEDPYWRGAAFAGVAPAVAAADPERAEAIARSIEDASLREQALAGVAPAVAAADPARAEAIARSIEDASLRSAALADLVRMLAQQHLYRHRVLTQADDCSPSWCGMCGYSVARAKARGTSGAHQREICPETLRTSEISTAGQTAPPLRRSRSEAVRHKTRPTGRRPPCIRSWPAAWHTSARFTNAPSWHISHALCPLPRWQAVRRSRSAGLAPELVAPASGDWYGSW